MWWAAAQGIEEAKKARAEEIAINVDKAQGDDKGKKDGVVEKGGLEGTEKEVAGIITFLNILQICVAYQILIFFLIYHVYGFIDITYRDGKPEGKKKSVSGLPSLEAHAQLGMAALFLTALIGAALRKADLLIPSFVGCAIHALLGLSLFFSDIERFVSIGYLAQSCGEDYANHRVACDALSVLHLITRLATVLLCLLAWSTLHTFWLHLHRTAGTLPPSQKLKTFRLY